MSTANAVEEVAGEQDMVAKFEEVHRLSSKAEYSAGLVHASCMHAYAHPSTAKVPPYKCAFPD
jgi:hypothetical protein